MPPPGRRVAARARPARRAWTLLVDATRGNTRRLAEAVSVRARRPRRRPRRGRGHRPSRRHLRSRDRAGDGPPAPRGGTTVALRTFSGDRGRPDLPPLGGAGLSALSSPLRLVLRGSGDRGRPLDGGSRRG